MSIKVGMIGLGAIGQRLIPQFKNHPDTEIVAVCDQREDLVHATAEKLNNIAAYTNHQELLSQSEVDLVYVAVPPKFHHNVASDVLTKGKHILCEKPLANSLEEAGSLLKQAQAAGVVHAMNFPLNYNAGSKTFAKLIKENYIGDLRRVELTLRFPEWPRPWQQNAWVATREQGGYVLEVGVHYIQQIQKIFGSLELAHLFIQFPNDPKSSENGILATLSLEDGTPVLFDGLSQIAGKEHIAFTAYGSEGSVSLINWAMVEGGKLGETIQPIEADQSLNESLIHHLVKAIKGEDASIIDFNAGYEAQKVLEALRK